MKKQTLSRFAFASLVLVTVPAFAHHSFSAEYDASKPIVINGSLTKLEWTNPHGWIYVDVKDDAGKVTSYAVEFGAPNAMLRRGLRKPISRRESRWS